jgi:hypothetical protein
MDSDLDALIGLYCSHYRMDLKEIGSRREWGGVDWIRVAQDRDLWRAEPSGSGATELVCWFHYYLQIWSHTFEFARYNVKVSHVTF